MLETTSKICPEIGQQEWAVYEIDENGDKNMGYGEEDWQAAKRPNQIVKYFYLFIFYGLVYH